MNPTPSPSMAMPPSLRTSADASLLDVAVPSSIVALRPQPTATSMAFSPDDATLTYLHRASPENADVRALYALDCASLKWTRVALSRAGQSGEDVGGDADYESLSKEEKLRRERQRVQMLGVTSYQWCAVGRKVLLPSHGEWVSFEMDADPLHGANNHPRATVVIPKKGDDVAIDAGFAPDGERVVFVRENDLFMSEAVEGAEPVRVTDPPAGEVGISNGVASYLAQEEMDRFHGWWMSPCGRYLAYERVDETQIPQFQITHSGADQPESEVYHYAFAGKANPKESLYVAHVERVCRSGSKGGSSANANANAPAGGDAKAAAASSSSSSSSSSADASRHAGPQDVAVVVEQGMQSMSMSPTSAASSTAQ